MKKWVTEENLAKIFCAFCLVLFAVLFYFGFVETWVNDLQLTTEYVAPQGDSLPGNILWLGAVFLGGSFLYQLEKRQKRKVNMDMVALVISLLAFAFSVYWVNAVRAIPQADQLFICSFAEQFENGNLDGLAKGKYVGIYQQQLGLITFMRLLFKLFGMGNYQVFQYFNACMIPVMIFSGYQIVKRLSADSKTAEICYLLLAATCVPMYCYVPFVYGEVASTALTMFGAWMLLWSFERFSPVKVALLSLALGVAVQLRRNALIFVIAFLIVLVIRLLRREKKQTMITLGGILLSVVLLQGCINLIYQRFIPRDSFSAPASVFIAMGVNNDNGMAGWHNYYDQFAFRDNGYDVAKTNQAAKEYLLAFAQNCKEDPRYAADFYYRKIFSQWNAPMYQCFAMTNNREGEPSEFVADAYFGSLRELLEAEMNVHQLVVYGGVLGLLLLVRKKWQQIDNYLLLIGAFGGFLFSVMWEAKTRYVFPYYLILLPYGAVGVYELVKAVWSKWACKVSSSKE